MEACDWFKIDENTGGTSAIFLLCLNPECIRLFNKTQGTMDLELGLITVL